LKQAPVQCFTLHIHRKVQNTVKSCDLFF
jgi:hypothetical protein